MTPRIPNNKDIPSHVTYDNSWSPGLSGLEVKKMFAAIAGRYDLANSTLSLGIHLSWRRKLLALADLPANSLVLDVCTGTGDLLRLLHVAGHQAVGIDFCLPMLKAGRLREKHTDLRFTQADALQLPFADSKFDALTVAFGVRNFEDLNAGLKELHRVLKPGAKLLILEFGQPATPGIKQAYDFYSKHILPKLGGWLTGNADAYAYLPHTASKFPCNLAFEQHLRDCRFEPITSKAIDFGIVWAYSAKKI